MLDAMKMLEIRSSSYKVSSPVNVISALVEDFNSYELLRIKAKTNLYREKGSFMCEFNLINKHFEYKMFVVSFNENLFPVTIKFNKTLSSSNTVKDLLNSVEKYTFDIDHVKIVKLESIKELRKFINEFTQSNLFYNVVMNLDSLSL